MKMEHQLIVPNSRDKVWDLLMDMPRVGQCFPGVEEFTAIDKNKYEGVMKVRVGPVSLRLRGTVSVQSQDAQNWRMAMLVEGAERRVGGGVRGIITTTLVDFSPSETELIIDADVSFMGKLGELGQPVIRKKADSVIKEFARNLARELAS